MKLSVEGTQEEIKEILSAIRISQEDRRKGLISASNIDTGVIKITPKIPTHERR